MERHSSNRCGNRASDVLAGLGGGHCLSNSLTQATHSISVSWNFSVCIRCCAILCERSINSSIESFYLDICRLYFVAILLKLPEVKHVSPFLNSEENNHSSGPNLPDSKISK